MDEQISEKLEALLKYIPFIDFIVDIDKEKYVKFLEIKNWIINKKRYSLNNLNKIERSIITQYKNMIGLGDKKIPKEIMQIFYEEFKLQYIDLCSDDEDNTNELNSPNTPDKLCTTKESDDDLEIISISYEEESKPASKSRIKKGPKINSNTSTKNISKVMCALDETSAELLKHIDQISIEDDKITEPHKYYHEDSEDDEKLFQRRSPNLFQRRCDLHKANEDEMKNGNENKEIETKRRCSAVPTTTIIDTISVDSSDDETSKIKSVLESKDIKKSSIEVVKNWELPEYKFDVTQKTKNSINKDPQKEKNSLNDQKSSEQKNLSAYTSIKTCLDTCTDERGDKCRENVEKLLLQVIKALIKSTSGEPTQKLDYPMKNMSTNCHQNSNNVNESPMPCQSNFPANQCNPQMFYSEQTLQNTAMYQHQYRWPNSAPQSSEAYFAQFQALANQRRLNLKDPRIRNWLNIHKNSPLLPLIERQTVANLSNTIAQGLNVNHPSLYNFPSGDQVAPTCAENDKVRHRTLSSVRGISSTQNRMTYGEYKRRRAEAQKKAEQQREEETKRQEDSLKDKLYGKLTKEPNSKGETDENRTVPKKTLEPCTKENYSAAELYTNQGPKTANTEDKSKHILNEKEESEMKNKIVVVPEENTELIPLADDSCTNKMKVVLNKTTKSTDIKEKLKRPSSEHNILPLNSKEHSSSISMCDYFQHTTTSRESCSRKRRKTIDDIPMTPLSKRRSSLNARTAIAKQLKSQTNEDFTNLKTSPLPRTGTLKRRKTIDDLPTHSKGSKNELNDFENFGSSKIEKFKKSMGHKQAKVLLKRLTENEIRNCTNQKRVENDEKDNTLNVLLVESTNQPIIKHVAVKKSSASKKMTKKRLNCDSKMTESNTRMCVLCSSRPADLTNHYVGKHKSESYISRLSWSQLDDLSINTPFARAASNAKSRVQRYTVRCPFCDDELEEPFMSLYNHYSTHTGEYAFQCSECLLKKPFKADIQSHQLHSKTCRSGHVQIMYRYPSNTMTIYLHYCVICNFVQLNEANIFRHLGDHHHLRQVKPSNVKKCILAAITDAPDICNVPQQNNETKQITEDKMSCQPKHLKSTSSEISESDIITSQQKIKESIKTEDDLILDDNIPVRNEACSEEQFDSTLCTLEQELKRMHEEPEVETTQQLTAVHCDIVNKTKPEVMSNIFQELHIQIKPEFIDGEDQCLLTPPRPSLQIKTLSAFTYRSYPPNVNYLGLYKCMADDCYYSTDLAEEFLNHIEDHGRESMDDEYLQCAYCRIQEMTFKSSQQLVNHIGEKHIFQIYQCSECCYRSCDASNVYVHLQECHKYETYKVYKVYGIQRTYSQQFINERIQANVRKLSCQYCHYKSFYHSNLLEHHIRTDHKDIQVQESYRNYSCIFCPLTNSDETVIRKHLAIEHPDELPYICSHNKSVAVNEDSLENLQACDLAQQVPVIELNTNLPSVADGETELPTEDVKPNVEEWLKCYEEIVKVRLRKITEHTGVAPDILFQCPVQSCGGFFSVFDLWLRHMRLRHHCLECECPHCPQQSIRSLESYKEHFEHHRRHTYICFHCPQTFSSYENASQHALTEHIVLGTMRFEQIQFNMNYFYFVMIQSELLTNRSELMPELLNRLDENLKEVERKESRNLKHNWLLSSLSSAWFEDYDAMSHRMFHICVACCSQHHCRLKLTKHIREEHSARDVPIITVMRNSEIAHFSLAIVFANECLSFSTLRNCFCCEERNLKSDAFILHLKQYHKFSMSYFCEYCNLSIKSLHVAKKHVELVHVGNALKIRCELASKSNLAIVSLHNFQVHIDSKVEKRPLPLNVVKQEPDDGDCVIPLEEDDVTLQDYVREREHIESKPENPILRCIATDNLLKPTKDTSSSVAINSNILSLPRIPIAQTKCQTSIIPISSLNRNSALNHGFNSQHVPTAPSCIRTELTPNSTRISYYCNETTSTIVPEYTNCAEAIPNYGAARRVEVIPPNHNLRQTPILATGNIIRPIISLKNTFIEETNRNTTLDQLKYTSPTVSTCFLNSVVANHQPTTKSFITNPEKRIYEYPNLNGVINHTQNVSIPQSTICTSNKMLAYVQRVTQKENK